MAKIIKTGLSEAYQKAQKVSCKEFNENNDCTVKALAFVMNIQYAEAHAMLAQRGRIPGHGLRNACVVFRELLEASGYQMIRIHPEQMIDKYPAAHQILKGVTTHHPERFNKVWRDGNNYLLMTKGNLHVAAVVNGTTHDWTKGRAIRVVDIYKIVKTIDSA